ncbi:hypothetical protein, partial [Eudoraea sp.]|uniref:hypothetical protein n=1 Tax=Eudoraea sp. TaxID=1979955 RepID=UPI003C76CEA0
FQENSPFIYHLRLAILKRTSLQCGKQQIEQQLSWLILPIILILSISLSKALITPHTIFSFLICFQ